MGTVKVDMSDIDAEFEALLLKKQRRLEAAEREAAREARENAKVLVATTPVKKEKPRRDDLPSNIPKPPKFIEPPRRPTTKQPTKKLPAQTLPSLPPSAVAGPSKMSSSLAAIQRKPSTSAPSKTSSFSRQWAGISRTITKPVAGSAKGKEPVSDDDDGLDVEEEGVKRDSSSLALIEKLNLGPTEFGFDPEGEESWEYVEPNSGIRLNKRTLPHADLQDHMYGRYYLPPSLLYSVIRLSRDGATYDVPVDGDWVTIAVVAERGEIRVSGGGNGGGGGGAAEFDSSDDDDDVDKKPVMQRGEFTLASPSKKKFQKKKAGKDDKEEVKRRQPKKYLNLKLAAMPARSRRGGSGGDAILQLLLFQAESIVRSEEEDEDGNVKVTHRGGSGGAFEKWGNLNVGDVIGVISPRVLRPLKSGGNAPHPLTLPLALNPYSGDSVFLIGKSKDLGCCSAMQRDGNRCRTWVDIRQGSVCEYHVHLAMSRSRGARAEFTASTSSFALTTSKASGSRPGFPPRKGVGINHQTKTGLLPASGPQSAPRGTENGGGGATYVVAGNPVRPDGRADGGPTHFGQEMLSEKLGRGRAEKRKRILERKETDKVLGRLMAGGQGSSGHRNLNAMKVGLGKGGDKQKSKRGRDQEEEEEDESEEEDKKRPFSAESIKKIGYDPSALARAAGLGKDEKKKKDESIASLKIQGGDFKFQPKKKLKITNVVAPDGYVPGADVGKKKDSARFYGGRKRGSDDDESENDSEEGMIDLD